MYMRLKVPSPYLNLVAMTVTIVKTKTPLNNEKYKNRRVLYKHFCCDVSNVQA